VTIGAQAYLARHERERLFSQEAIAVRRPVGTEHRYVPDRGVRAFGSLLESEHESKQVLSAGEVCGDDGMLELELSRSRYGPVDTRNDDTRDLDGMTPSDALAAMSQQGFPPRERTVIALSDDVELLEIGPSEIGEIQRTSYASAQLVRAATQSAPNLPQTHTIAS
jgi:hypothetical protein